MHKVQMRLSRFGARVFRNNCGSVKDERSGNWIKYGVASPGGSDLIGWTPVKITQAMVGKTVAVFTACETKTPNGKVSSDQAHFLTTVKQHGGFGFVARHETEAVDELHEQQNRLQRIK